MNWTTLFSMQKKLDDYIAKSHSLVDEDLFDQKVLALIVELSELANETRSFKFWSMNQSSDREQIVEEFVDGIHFMLSLGLEKGLTFTGKGERKGYDTLNEQFLYMYEVIVSFKKSPTQDTFNNMLLNYLHLGILLNISEEELFQAYIEKNEVNFQRQDEGY